MGTRCQQRQGVVLETGSRGMSPVEEPPGHVGSEDRTRPDDKASISFGVSDSVVTPASSPRGKNLTGQGKPSNSQPSAGQKRREDR